ncbi:hypothetical protein [Undibacterium sp.]|uniref:hypothetical protein n=1 Tax=Undibacterium sp. TaxID=1914977 RepID=UPI003751C2DE
MKTYLRRMSVLALLASLSACSILAKAPLSYLEAKPDSAIHSSSQYPVRVVSVDGSIQFSMPVQIAPGERDLVLEAMPSRSALGSKQKKFRLKIAPCTRYFLLAQRDTPMQADWQLIIHSTEVVSACDPVEELKKEAGEAKVNQLPTVNLSSL